MANLNRSESGFLCVSSATGALKLRWPPARCAELHAWVLLIDPTRLTPADLHPERLLSELIRIPLAPESGLATVYVPVARPLGVMLVARDDAGEPLEPPALEVELGRPVTRTATQPPPREAPSRAAPQIDPRAYTPLVFAANRNPPDFGSLARRVAERVAPGPSAPSTPSAPSNPSTESMNRPPSPSTASIHPVSGFGARQRWTLTRLAFPRGRDGVERVIVARTSFIAPHDVAAWAIEPPRDACPVPAECDGLVDGASPEDTMIFYLLLERDRDAWLPIVPSLVPPPFDTVTRPALLGDPVARLEALPPQPSEAFAALMRDALESAVRGLPVRETPR